MDRKIEIFWSDLTILKNQVSKSQQEADFWKNESERLYLILDELGVDYIKQMPKDTK